MLHTILRIAMAILLAALAVGTLTGAPAPQLTEPPRVMPQPSPVPGQDGLDLKWRFSKGEVFDQEVTTELKLEMKVMDTNLTSNFRQTSLIRWSPEFQDESANWFIGMRIEAVKANGDFCGTKIAIDSTKKAAGDDPLATLLYKTVTDSRFTVITGPGMEEVRFGGYKEFADKVIKADPKAESLLKQCLSESTLKQMAESTLGSLPNKVIKKGSSWTKVEIVDLGPSGSTRMTNTYTHVGQEGKYQKIKVSSALEYQPPKQRAEGNEPFRLTKVDLKDHAATGTLLFDERTGRVARSEFNLNLQAKLTIEMGGFSSEVDLRQTQKTTVKITDQSPLKKKAAE
jgi:hypothetical protein